MCTPFGSARPLPVMQNHRLTPVDRPALTALTPSAKVLSPRRKLEAVAGDRAEHVCVAEREVWMARIVRRLDSTLAFKCCIVLAGLTKKVHDA